MTFYQDLAEQAQHLLRREPKRPRQASLRRAVSAAYYAVFHLLLADASAALAKGSDLRLRVQRAFDHKSMKVCCTAFYAKNLPASIAGLVTAPLEPEIVGVSKAFVELQQARHSADYDLSSRLSRNEARRIVALANGAIADWHTVRRTDNARVFLTALLLHERWNR